MRYDLEGAVLIAVAFFFAAVLHLVIFQKKGNWLNVGMALSLFIMCAAYALLANSIRLDISSEPYRALFRLGAACVAVAHIAAGVVVLAVEKNIKNEAVKLETKLREGTTFPVDDISSWSDLFSDKKVMEKETA